MLDHKVNKLLQISLQKNNRNVKPLKFKGSKIHSTQNKVQKYSVTFRSIFKRETPCALSFYLGGCMWSGTVFLHQIHTGAAANSGRLPCNIYGKLQRSVAKLKLGEV